MTIEQLQDFFCWCAIINLGALMLSFLMILAFRGMIFSMHAKLFALPEESVAGHLYALLGSYKILTFVFCVIPWIALQLI